MTKLSGLASKNFRFSNSSNGIVLRDRSLTDSEANRAQLLSGWKEIANYMHQGVRTIQRWERNGLPVRRVTSSGRGPVIALAEDLDNWTRSLRSPLLDRIEELSARVSSLETQIRFLKRELRVKNRSASLNRPLSSASRNPKITEHNHLARLPKIPSGSALMDLADPQQERNDKRLA